MMNQYQGENLVERLVTYTLEFKGKFYIIKNVPARVNGETGEQFFSPTTVERLHRTILGHARPIKLIETPVYEYTEMSPQG
jgi:YgiT-type zinc finger domain-containing protein